MMDNRNEKKEEGILINKNSKKKNLFIVAVIIVIVVFLTFMFRSEKEEIPFSRKEIVDDQEEKGVPEEVEDVETKEEVQERIEGEKETRIDPEEGEYEVIVYTGTGSETIRIEKPEAGPTIFYGEGNESGKHFIITGYSMVSTYLGGKSLTYLFVNTFQRYEGFFLDPDGKTNLLEIEGEGPWRVEVHPLSSARAINVPGEISGKGSEVLQIEGSPQKATVVGNTEAYNEPKNFEVNAYNPRRQSLVSTGEVYEGTVEISSDATLLEVITNDEWKIILE